jgi:hypothetical protein
MTPDEPPPRTTKPRDDGDLCREGTQRPGEDLGLWMLKVERQQGQPSRRRPGWMDGIAPVDEEGDGAATECVGGEAPAQQGSLGGGPLELDCVPGVIALGARLGDAGVDVVAADRPAHQPRAVERVEAERARHRGYGLVRVGGNDLQVHALAEAKERVVGAQPLVLAAGLRPHPEAALELVHAVRQHRDAIDQVVNHAHAASASATRPASREHPEQAPYRPGVG